ncbi:MAG: hypothetical protein ACT4QF_01525 [Sporichthyaceae bacterium]
MATFDVTQISINVTGTQTFTTDAHVSNRGDQGHPEMIVVTVGTCLVHVYDLAAARAFATACRTAAGYLPADFPATSPHPSAPETEAVPGVLLRVAGTPAVNRIHGFGASFGRPHVRIHLGRLVVRFLDEEALASWTAGWQDVERLALRLWPTRDAYDRAPRSTSARSRG